MSDAKRRRLNAAFSAYLRTGRFIAPLVGNGIEAKFNPWHDPEDGRFTFAGQGNYFGRGSPAARIQRVPSISIAPREAPSRRPVQSVHMPKTARDQNPSGDQIAGTLLTSTHREFLSNARKFPARPGTRSSWPSPGHPLESKGAFKDQFVRGHADAFRAAAKQFDLPVELVASVAHAELGNDSLFNDLGYAGRAENGRNLPDLPVLGRFNKPRDETSFGFFGIQQRRAAEILGYGDINSMSETARRTLVPTTRDPVAATFMLAKHLSDLRTLDFPGVRGKDLTQEQLIQIATRYNRGPDIDFQKVRQNRRAGRNYLSLWRRVKRLLQNSG